MKGRQEPLVEKVLDTTRSLSRLRRFWLPASFCLCLVLLGLTVALMINPAAIGPSLPLSDEDVGKVAPADIRAPISFTVPDVEATDRKRLEAEVGLRSVYDFEQELGSERQRRLKDAFNRMQTFIRDHEAALDALVPQAEEGLDARDPKKPRPVRKPPKKVNGAKGETESEWAQRQRAEFSAMLDEQRGEFLKLLAVVVREDDFVVLKEDRFSAESLQAISGLVERTMRHMIVPSRDLLSSDRAKGITVRFLRDGTPERELVVTSFTRILDTDEALLRVDQSAALELGAFSPTLRAAQIHIAKALIAPNTFYNRTETERRKKEARDSVQPLEMRVQKDAIIIRDGDVVERRHIRVCRELAKLTEVSNAFQMLLGTVLMVVAAFVFTGIFAARTIRKFRHQPRDLALLALVMFLSLVGVKVWFWVFGAVFEQFRLFPLQSYYFAIPFAAGAMLVRFVQNSETALTFTAVFAILTGLVMDSSLVFALYCLAGSLIGALAVGRARLRTSLLRAGITTGLANAVLALGASLFAGEIISFEAIFTALFAFSGGILAAVVVTGVAPLLEVIFGYTTDIKLLELANLNHPLLKDLIVQAPGSYHHSIIVGSLVEAAAESIHCNPLLARVMAYYHDIGKIKKPAYFSENQRDGVNRHDKLKASLSASVLRAHVKDGAELAREYRLGQPIVDAIVQHHGTSLMKFFYQRAREQSQEDAVAEEDFRYPGPRPKTREVALVMLADSVEAAAKSIQDPSPARLQGLVQNIINRIFVDGQLDECDLTLRDLHEIARAFNRVLAGIYHHRPDYPEPATREIQKTKPDLKDEPLKREGDERRQETPDGKQEDIKRLGI